jgi:hypothetical protein
MTTTTRRLVSALLLLTPVVQAQSPVPLSRFVNFNVALATA